MKTLTFRSLAIRRVLAVSAMTMLGASAMAQNNTGDRPAPPPGVQAAHEGHDGARGEPPRFDAKKFAEREHKREEIFKTRLQLTPQQEGAWATWLQTVKPQQPQQQDRIDPRAEREAFAKLTTPERIDRMRALKAQHQMRETQREDATKAFYAALTPAQKKVFDQETLHRFGPGSGPGFGPEHGFGPGQGFGPGGPRGFGPQGERGGPSHDAVKAKPAAKPSAPAQ